MTGVQTCALPIFGDEYGTLTDFKNMVSLAHEMGFKVILDWVANHTGWDHVWTVEHPGYYKIDEATADFKKASGMDDIIELDLENGTLQLHVSDDELAKRIENTPDLSANQINFGRELFNKMRPNLSNSEDGATLF